MNQCVNNTPYCFYMYRYNFYNVYTPYYTTFINVLLYLQESQDGKTNFVKVHAPWDVLTRMAELMNLKMPIKVSSISVS